MESSPKKHRSSYGVRRMSAVLVHADVIGVHLQTGEIVIVRSMADMQHYGLSAFFLWNALFGKAGSYKKHQWHITEKRN